MHSWLLPLILAAGSGPAMETDKLALPGAITTVVPGDVNADGARDLLVFWRQGEPPEAKDRVSLFLFQQGRFKQVPDQVMTLPAGSVVFDVGDANLDKHTDVVVLKSNGLWALKGTGEGLSKDAVQLVRVATVAAFPREKYVPREKLLIKLDGGRLGILLPTVPIGLLSFYEFQPDKGYLYRRSLRVPSKVRVGTGYASEENTNRGSSFCFNYPGWTLGDNNGDQWKDLVFFSGEKVAIFRGGSDGNFKQDPDVWNSFDFPRTDDDDGGAAKAWTGDVNGDGRIDLVFSRTESKGLTDFASRIWMHLAKQDGSYPGKPDILINRKGIGGLDSLKDLNNDGRDDLLFTVTDLGVGSIIGMVLKGGGTVDVSLQMYLSRGSSYPDKPDGELTSQFVVDRKTKDSPGPANPVFGWDFDSDGKADLAMVDAGAGSKSTPDRLRIRRGDDSGVKFFETLWQADFPGVKSLTPFRLRPGQPPGLLVQLKSKEKHQGDVLVLRNKQSVN